MLKLMISFLVILMPLSWADSFGDAITAYDQGDYTEALRLFSELEVFGHIDATNNLATMHQLGVGVPRNYVKAAELYLQAAKSGHIDAAFNYSTLARLGIGVQKNMADAYAWSVIAARHGASDLIAYRDVLAMKIKPQELTDGSKQAELILEDLMAHEYEVGWLLPNNVRLAARETPIPPSINKIEQISAEGEITVIKDEDVKKITEENAGHFIAPSYRAVFTGFPLSSSASGYLLYRPMLNAAKYSDQNILRPRRVIVERSVPIVDVMDIDSSLLPLFQSLADSYGLHINDIVRVTQAMNPGVFEEDSPLRLKDSDTRLNIPTYSQVKDF